MKNLILFLSILLLVSTIGCKKYLDEKSDQSLVLITSSQDLQALLDNNSLLNLQSASADMMTSDDFYISFKDFQSLGAEEERNLYTWQEANVFQSYTSSFNDWARVYNMVYLANVVLENVDKIQHEPSNQAMLNNIKGQALFIRSHSLFRALSIWSLAFDETTADGDLGVPLRLSSDFNKVSTRASVRKSYNQVIQDLQESAELLLAQQIHTYRPSKAAAYGLLSRVYLSMRKYDSALTNAEKCLAIQNTLIDFNTLNPLSTYPVVQFNKEIIYDCSTDGTVSLSRGIARMDSLLIKKYETNDLRKQIFFETLTDGSSAFKGSYEGKLSFFNGLSVNEIYLIRSECLARAGRVSSAMTELNTLLKNRYKTGFFNALTIENQQQAIAKILLERQKELIMRGLR
ncbi:RagB/SusD family nutrient uptake outer membrane protein, partial [Pedobacter sp.]|uniref:RagB/SusD family nutrient uptake outer membrane protein n=1 Tax=Pedobacter sp. TaxID=1411316 RepID=UPI003C5E1154